jgi:hypothetical protein
MTRASKLVNRKKICLQGSLVRTFAPYSPETHDVIASNLFARCPHDAPPYVSSERWWSRSC